MMHAADMPCSARPTSRKAVAMLPVGASAMFIMLASRPRSFCMAGAMFRVVCAKSQNVMTPRMMP